MKENWTYRRGDIYLANLNPYIGSEQGGTRPVLLLQNNTGNFYCPTLIVAPLTARRGKKPHQPTHYLLNSVKGMDGASVVLLEQIKTIDKRRVVRYIGRVSREQMDGVNEALQISLGLYIPEEMEIVVLPENPPRPPKSLWATIYIGKGKKEKLSRIDIAGFLYKKGNLTREDVGAIDVKEHYAFVAVRRAKVKQLLNLIQGEKIKGMKTIIEEAK